jgi:hypothetical protein
MQTCYYSLWYHDLRVGEREEEREGEGEREREGEGGRGRGGKKPRKTS